ncbi:MAG TPA: ABC transporter permease [Thermoanaerobaculia bacterium]|jgi:predicted permease|nr:ABC transporter permease [Thermoanaerobaculia bacterium]
METLLGDLRYALRMLVKRPAFTLVAVSSLALGIGANTTIFSVVNALLLRSLPVADPARLVSIYTRDAQNPAMLAGPLSHLNWRDYREQSRSFSGILGYDWAGMSFTRGADSSLLVGQLVSDNYFALLGVRAERGRLFTTEEGIKPGAHPVAVVSHHFWQQRLGGDPDVIGRAITLDGNAFTVVGVAPERFTGTDTGVQPELWVPMAMNRQIKPDAELNWYEERRGLFVWTIGRLRSGVTLAAAQAEMTAIARRLEQEYPNDNRGRTVRLLPLSQAAVNPQVRGALVGASLLLLGVVGLVLLIACANVANLLLARATARRREIAIRLTQGARRGRLVRQLLTESLLLALLGGALGLLLMTWANHALLAFLPSLPFPVTLTLDLGADPRVLAFALAVTLATGLLFGLLPALQSSRPQLVAALKSHGAAAAAPAGRGGGMGLRGALVAGQVALSLMALIASGLFLRSLDAAQHIDTGYDTPRLSSLAFDVGLYGLDRGRGEQLFRGVREQVGTLPGIASVALAQAGPLQAGLSRSIFLEGREDPSNNGVLVTVDAVDPTYFRTVGVPLVAGRGFADADRAGAQPVVIVNRTMAEKFWPGQSALGKRFHFHGQPAVEVVGVARDAKYGSVSEDPQPHAYEPLAQNYATGVTLVVRAVRDPQAVLPGVQRQLRALAPGMPLVIQGTMAHQIDQSLWAPRFAASLLALFGALALLLATLGIYGVMSFSVAQRARDIGVRMALGARRGEVLGMVLSQGMKLVAAGLAIGLLLAAAVSRLASGLLIGVSAVDPVAFLATPPLLALVALVSIYVPARRATAVDPTVVLRYD